MNFTFETGEDYTDKWLPTLDTSLRVGEDNVVEYKYYEKPTTTNSTIRKTSAMGEKAKIQSLSNDLLRRLGGSVCKEAYYEWVYSKEQVQKILLNGIKS